MAQKTLYLSITKTNKLMCLQKQLLYILRIIRYADPLGRQNVV
jgi:hypothetical protein